MLSFIHVKHQNFFSILLQSLGHFFWIVEHINGNKTIIRFDESINDTEMFRQIILNHIKFFLCVFKCI